jgi:hypothetical protein
MYNTRPRVALFGKHSNRTPFAYKTYRSILSQSIEFVSLDDSPQLIITGFSKDFFDSLENRFETFQRPDRAKLMVVSEEPLWDTIYSNSYQTDVSEAVATIKGSDIEFNFYNHTNSDLFEYLRVPYYLTTSVNYISRYVMLVNSILSKFSSGFFSERVDAPVFGMFERRTEPWFNFSSDNAKCLCIYRSLFAEQLFAHATIQGVGHGSSSSPRQALPDWHLDKLAKAYMQHNLVISIENTCHKYYVTEKIFDAYAVGAIPIYYAPPEHSVRTSLGLASFFDVSSMEPNDAALSLIDFKSRINDNVDLFFRDLQHIVQSVLDPVNYWDEIRSRSDRLVSLVLHCLQS